MTKQRNSNEAPVQTIICYADKDKSSAARLEKNLKPSCNTGRLHVWHRGLSIAGGDYRQQESDKLNEAEIVLLLISPDFMSDEGCQGLIERSMDKLSSGKTSVIPIDVRPANKDGALFAALTALPQNSVPISQRKDKDRAWIEVAEGVLRAAKHMREIHLSHTAANHSPLKSALPQVASLSLPHPKLPDRFTVNLGNGGIYLTGPRVICYLSPSAVLRIANGPPWEDEADAPTILSLRGNSFRGEFYVAHGWSMSSESESCICSGFYPCDGLPLRNGSHDLSDGAKLFYQYGKTSYVAVPLGKPNLEERKKKAMAEAQTLWGQALQCDEWSEWAWTKYKPPLTAAVVWPEL